MMCRLLCARNSKKLRGQKISPTRPIVAVILALLLTSPNLTQADERSCESWFGGSNTPLSGASNPELSSLNEASQEYVARIKYVVLERRLLKPETLEQIIASATPLNPFGNRAQSVAMQPHQLAFSELLKEELQWTEIRQVLQAQLRSSSQEQKRQEVATEETSELFSVALVKTYPFAAEKLIRTSQGKTFAISVIKNPNERTITLKISSFPSGDQVSSLTLQGELRDETIAVKEARGTLITSIPIAETQSFVSIDLLQGKIMPPPKFDHSAVYRFLFRKEKLEGTVSQAHLLEDASGLAAVTFLGTQVYFIDPFSGHILNKLPYTEIQPGEILRSGATGTSIFATNEFKYTHLINPTNDRPVLTFRDDMIINTYEHQGQTYALMIDRSATDSNFVRIAFNIRNLETGAMVGPFYVPGSYVSWPRLIDRFEFQGHLYGLLVSATESYVIDLLEGKTITAAPTLENGQRVDLHNLAVRDGDKIGIDHEDRHYIPGLIWDGPRNSPRLAVFDAMTLRPVSPFLQLARQDVDSVRLVPGDDKNLKALVNFHNGTSVLVSLMKKI